MAIQVLNRLFIFLFFIIITLPFIQLEFKFLPDFELNEKRNKVNRPNQYFHFHSMKDLKSSLAYFSLYIEDNFGFRDIYIFLNTRIKFAIFALAPTNVIVGKDGWLFHDIMVDGKIDPKEVNNDFMDTAFIEKYNAELTAKGNDNIYTEYSIPDYLGLAPFKDADLEQIKNNLESLESYFKSKNIKFIVVIAPNKHTIYPEFLPEWIINKERKISRLDQVMNYLEKNSTFKLYDYRKIFFEKKKTFQVYRKLDTHLNDEGNVLFANEILSNLNHSQTMQIESEDIIFETKKIQNGDLVDLSGLPGVFDEMAPFVKFKKKNSMECSESLKASIAKSSIFCKMIKNSNLPKLFIFGDSFGEFLTSVLKEKFSKYVLFSYSAQIEEETLLNEKPDFIILELVERSIYRLKTSKLVKR